MSKISNETKISNEIRLEAVQRVVEDGMSISASARLAGVHKSMLQEWVMQYREHGAEGVIKQDRKQKKYTGEFKIEVVEYAHTNHLSAGAASAHFGLSTKSLFLKWERIYYEEGPQALLEERRGRASKMGKNVGRKRKLPDQTKEDLIAEVQRLRMENSEILTIWKTENNLDALRDSCCVAGSVHVLGLGCREFEPRHSDHVMWS